MAGQLGAERVTVQNLEVVATDADEGLILVKGGVPGSKGTWIRVTDAKKRALPDDVPLPAGLKGDAAPEAADAEDAAPAEEAGAPSEKQVAEAEPEVAEEAAKDSGEETETESKE